jgi:hypothetical protein
MNRDELVNYFTYHYLLGKKIIRFIYRNDEIILGILRLSLCCFLILNFLGCINILLRKEYFFVLQSAIESLEIGFILVNLIFIILFLVSCKSTYVFFFKGLNKKENKYTHINYSIEGNNYFKVKKIFWYLGCFALGWWLLFIIVTDERLVKTLPNIPFLIFSTLWVVGSINFLKRQTSDYFNKLFFEFQMETTIQVDYLDFQNDKIIDKNPHVQEGQLLKIQVEPYPKNKENANLISILNTKTPNKEAVVFQFYDKFIAEQIRNDNNAIEVSVIKILPYFKLDLKLKRNFLFDDEKKIYD